MSLEKLGPLQTVNAKMLYEVVKSSLSHSSLSLFERAHSRTGFKVNAADYHLEKLKEIESRVGGLIGEERFSAEVELSAFFHELIGALDSLLFEINYALELGIPDREVCRQEVNRRLKDKGIDNKALLREVNKIDEKDSWLWRLNNYRNSATHMDLIPKHIHIALTEDVGQGVSKEEFRRAYLLKDPFNPQDGFLDQDVISYCKDSLEKIIKMIEDVYGKLIKIIKEG
jgi:hypothetical protein